MESGQLLLLVNDFHEVLDRENETDFPPPPSDKQIEEILECTMHQYGIPETHHPKVTGARLYRYSDPIRRL